MLLFDTSGIEAWVTENNPKYANRIIKQLKAFKKAKGMADSFDPYKAAYGSMPSHAAANPAIQQMYINGHFCYAYKFGIITNGLGIVRDISFYNKDFLAAHPDIIVGKKSDSPDEDKSLADSKALIPTLRISFASIRLSIRKLFWETPHLIPLKSTNTCYRKLPLSRLTFPSTAESPFQNPTAR